MPSDDVTKRFFDDLAERRCPFCQKRIELARQDEAGVYFDPCLHYMAQADAGALMRVWEADGI